MQKVFLRTKILTAVLLASVLCALASSVVPMRLQSAQDSISMSDSLADGDSILLSVDTDTIRAKRKQLTVDSVLNSYTADSILEMLREGRVLEVAPDSSKMDTVRRDTVKQSKSALDQPVHYSAKDSVTFDYDHSLASLYGEGKVNYQNLELQADLITMDLDESLAHATGRRDTTGAVNGAPVFRQGNDE